jgi:hypothetical protein
MKATGAPRVAPERHVQRLADRPICRALRRLHADAEARGFWYWDGSLEIAVARLLGIDQGVRGLKLFISATNLANKLPPYSTHFRGYDIYNYDLVGRTFFVPAATADMRAGTALRVALCATAVAWCPRAPALDPSLDVSQYAHTAWRSATDFPKAWSSSMAQTPDGYLWLGNGVRLASLRWRQDGSLAAAGGSGLSPATAFESFLPHATERSGSPRRKGLPVGRTAS